MTVEDPGMHRVARSEMILELLYKWRLKDMWPYRGNPYKLKEGRMHRTSHTGTMRSPEGLG